jgi:hypothetical protein
MADTLIDNVDGVTIDATGGIDRFTGLVIAPDGRIAQVLHRGEKRPPRPDYKVDGQGRDPDSRDDRRPRPRHGAGFAAMTLDLSQASSLAQAQAMIAAYAREHPDRPWILGRGWNQELWAEKRFPTAAELDAVVADRPVWLMRVDGHAGWANSRALAIAGRHSDQQGPGRWPDRARWCPAASLPGC